MRLLVVNFEMDRLSRTMPWSQRVVNLLARDCEKVVVLTGRVGDYEPPPNVIVETIPPRPFGVPRRLGSARLVNLHAFRLIRRHRLQVCFIHMAMDWAYYLRPSLRWAGMPVLLWYAHGTVTDMLRRAHGCATRVVTSSPEGFRIPSDKVVVIGQGVDTDVFDLQPGRGPRCDILSVARISPRKHIELLIDAMGCLKEREPDLPLRLIIAGTTVTQDDQYYEIRLREDVWKKDLQDRIVFAGYVPQEYLPSFYRSAFLHVNVSRTGSMDKTVLEALACGCPVLTGNEAFRGLLAPYPDMLLSDERPDAIAARILHCYHVQGSWSPRALRSLVIGRHDIHTYVSSVLRNLRELCPDPRRGKA